MEPQNPPNGPSPASEDFVQPQEQVIKPTIPVSGNGPILSPDPLPAVAPVAPVESPQPTFALSPNIVPDTNPYAAPTPIAPIEAAQPPLTPPITQPVAQPSAFSAPPSMPSPVMPLAPTVPVTEHPGVLPTPIVGGSDVPQASIVLPKKKRLVPKTLFVALLAVLLLGGSSASAYYGVVVPNKPENVLKAAVANSLSQPQVQFKGIMDVGPATGAGMAYKATMSGGSNSTDKSAQFILNLTVSGATISFEARLVDGNIYVKIGDLSTITGLLGATSPELSTAAKSLNTILSNQWVVIDSTLIKQSGVSCALDTSRTLNSSDLKILESQYKINNFVTIVSTSSDTVNGKKVTKMVLSIDDDKAATYSKGLGQLSIIKALKACSKDTSPLSSLVTADHDKTPLTVWIDKGTKQVVQISSTSTAQDAKKDNLKGTATIGLSYDNIKITAPTGAKPAIQVLTELETTFSTSGIDLTSLFSGFSTPSLGGSDIQSRSDDSKRQADIMSLQTQMEAYFSQNGNYPSLSEVNDPTWRKTNMNSLDPSAMTDPSSSATTLAAKPAKGVYAYQVTDATGASCESDSMTCASYTLTATLSDGTTYEKKSLD